MEDLINELEKKQTEIYVDMEDFCYVHDCTQEFANGFEEGYLAAFDLAIQIIKEKRGEKNG